MLHFYGLLQLKLQTFCFSGRRAPLTSSDAETSCNVFLQNLNSSSAEVDLYIWNDLGMRT